MPSCQYHASLALRHRTISDLKVGWNRTPDDIAQNSQGHHQPKQSPKEMSSSARCRPSASAQVQLQKKSSCSPALKCAAPQVGNGAGAGPAPSRQGGASGRAPGGLPRPGPVLGRQSSMQPSRAPSIPASAPQVRRHHAHPVMRAVDYSLPACW